MSERTNATRRDLAQVRVGVTGHRRLADPNLLTLRVGEALACLRTSAGALDKLCLTVVSPLAEGADRLVARRVLEEPRARLEALLPLPIEDYQRDFATAASRREFLDLLQRALLVEVLGQDRADGRHGTNGAGAPAKPPMLPPGPKRDAAYRAVGEAVLARCDVLIAIWDGQPARGLGGTAEIVEAARRRGHPLIWIEAAPPAPLHCERLGSLQARRYES